MRLPKPLCQTLQSTQTSKQKRTNTLPDSLKKRVTPRQYAQKRKKTTEKENNITARISLEGHVLSYVRLNFSNNQHRKALIDTSAYANAISEKDYDEL